MQAPLNPDLPCIHNIGVIHVQSFDRGPTNGGYPNNIKTVIFPGKMILPNLLVRVKEHDDITGLWVDGGGFHPLFLVTVWTSQLQVIFV